MSAGSLLNVAIHSLVGVSHIEGSLKVAADGAAPGIIYLSGMDSLVD